METQPSHLKHRKVLNKGYPQPNQSKAIRTMTSLLSSRGKTHLQHELKIYVNIYKGLDTHFFNVKVWDYTGREEICVFMQTYSDCMYMYELCSYSDIS